MHEVELSFYAMDYYIVAPLGDSQTVWSCLAVGEDASCRNFMMGKGILALKR